MIQKGNKPLSRCKLFFPNLPNLDFMGSFEIKNDILSFWLEFNKNDLHLNDLVSLMKKKDVFTVQIIDGNEQGYSCFKCYAINDFDITHNNFGLIKFFCASWFESFIIDSEVIPFAKSVILEFPFIEYWFADVDNTSFTVRNGYEIIFHNKKQESIDKYKCKYLIQRNCSFEIRFNKEKSLEDILKTEESIWLFLRFATNIPIPRANICIPCSDSESSGIYHFQFGHHPIIEDYASALSYNSMTIKINEIIDKKDLFSKWHTFLNAHYHAVKMWSKEMNRTSLLDERISHYMQIFDSLTKDSSNQNLKKRIYLYLEKYNKYIPCEIKEETPSNLKNIRVAFSHLNDEDFIKKGEVSSKQYLQYEKILQLLIKMIIKENLGL